MKYTDVEPAARYGRRKSIKPTAPPKPVPGITFRASVAVDVGRHDLNLHTKNAVNVEDGTYLVTLTPV